MGENVIWKQILWVTRGDPKREPMFVISGDHITEFVAVCKNLGLAFEATHNRDTHSPRPIIAIKITEATLDAYIAEHESAQQVRFIKQDLFKAVENNQVLTGVQRFFTNLAR